MTPIYIPAAELHLADVVHLENMEAWSFAIVRQIKDGMITFYRPYGTTENFSYTGGVICYMGLEEFTRTVNPREMYTVVQRKELR